jgi:16S rRNA (guanine966-N2)-methyltransferase
MSMVRIIAGQWRSRRICVPDLPGLRPTPDRVRETVFNWLGQTLHDWHCLDAFAGSGAMGFEAASRGASRVVLLERDPRAIQALRHTKTALNAQAVEIVRQDALEWRPLLGAPAFDLVFLDPPYGQGWLDRVLPCLEHWLKPEGWLYVEAEYVIDRLGPWESLRQAQAGRAHCQLMQRGVTS